MALYLLFLLLTLLVLLGNALIYSPRNIFLNNNLDGDKVFGPTCPLPNKLLEVEYDETIIHPGENIDFLKVSLIPSFVGYADCDPQKYYDLIMFDPDENALTTPFLYWWIANIPNCDMSQGESVADYLPPSPTPGPPHRFIVALFEHKNFENSGIEYNRLYHDVGTGRLKFNVPEVFCSRFSGPVSLNLFLTQDNDTTSITKTPSKVG